MAAQSPGDTRTRRRITTVLSGVGGAGQSATGISSTINTDLGYCTYHHVVILLYGVITGGVVSIRGKPTNFPEDSNFGASSAVPIGIESINLATEKTTSWVVDGFFAGFELNVVSAITGGGKIAAIVNSIPQY